MDELLSNLDRSTRDGIRAQTITVLRELGTTGAMVPHHASEALPVGNCVVLMRAGAIVQRGRVAISLTGRVRFSLYPHPRGLPRRHRRDPTRQGKSAQPGRPPGGADYAAA